MNRTEAQIKVDEMNDTASKRFCPLIKGNCNIECVSFSPAECIAYSHQDPDNVYIQGGYCAASMLVKKGDD